MRFERDDVLLPNVEIHVTESCNNRCGFCTTGWVNAEDDGKIEHVSRAILRTQMENAYASGARRALFHGGEPTVRRDLGELVEEARSLGFLATTIFTNGRQAASERGARWLVDMNVTWFQISVQGGTAAAHDASVRAKGAFDQTIAGIRNLIRLGARVKINGVLTGHLVDSLPEFAALMIELRPEEVGIDTVKPSGAFGTGRAAYADEVVSLAPHAARIRDAMLAMDRAGLAARLTSFPYCLAPGVEHLVSEEAPTTLTHQTSGNVMKKHLWKQSLQVKAPSCASCAYDSRCNGVYTPYAELHGLDGLRPYREIATPAAIPPESVPESRLGAALARVFRNASSKDVSVESVREEAAGVFELECTGPTGGLRISLREGQHEPAYAHTERFSVAFYRGSQGDADQRVVDTVVRALRHVEARLPR
jgi:MoaA/NifB/PqqE/SkfB family radical SAM enzyme